MEAKEEIHARVLAVIRERGVIESQGSFDAFTSLHLGPINRQLVASLYLCIFVSLYR